MTARQRQIGMWILLCLALGLTFFCAVEITHAVERFHSEQQLAASGDVRAIRPWMTLSYVARTYHVPESYLLDTLNISDPRSVRHVTLNGLAARLGESPDTLIKQIQTAILTYRQEHPPTPTPPTPHSAIPPPPPSAWAGRAPTE